jgi:hypothetical protein
MDDGLAAPRWVSSQEVPSWHGSEILPRLFMGGTADRDVVHVAARRRNDFGDPRPYDAVVTLYAWAHPVSWEVEELRYGRSGRNLQVWSLAPRGQCKSPLLLPNLTRRRDGQAIRANMTVKLVRPCR